MNREQKREFRQRFGEAKRKGWDARQMLTSFRWIRYKLTGSPLTANERERLEDALYPNMQTTREGFDSMNLKSLIEKYKGESLSTWQMMVQCPPSTRVT